MPKYNVEADFWQDGLLVPAGSTVTMTEAEAKYRKHFLKEVGAETAKPVEAPDVEADEPASVAVEEKPVVTGQSKRRRHAESPNADQPN